MQSNGGEVHVIRTRHGCTVWQQAHHVLMPRLTHEQAVAVARRLGGRIIEHDSIKKASKDPRVPRSALID